MDFLSRTINSIRRQGFYNTILKAFALIADVWFDVFYGVNTFSCSELSDLTIKSENRDRGVKYQPSRVLPLKKLFKYIKPIVSNHGVLVDFGCGKGRVLMLAALSGFNSVKGIEFAHELVEIAKNNVAIFSKKSNCSSSFLITECDATDYKIGHDENVFFMFNPFNDEVMGKIIKNIELSLIDKNRSVLIVYNNPTQEHLFSKHAVFKKTDELFFMGHKFVLYQNEL